MLDRVTDFSSSRRGKWIVIAVWLILAGVVVPLAPTLADVTTNDSSTFLPEAAAVPAGPAAVRAQLLMVEAERRDGLADLDAGGGDVGRPGPLSKFHITSFS